MRDEAEVALERAERERAECEAGWKNNARAVAELTARAQKAEAELESIRAALAYPDEPPTEQIPGAGHPTC